MQAAKTAETARSENTHTRGGGCQRSTWAERLQEFLKDEKTPGVLALKKKKASREDRLWPTPVTKLCRVFVKFGTRLTLFIPCILHFD